MSNKVMCSSQPAFDRGSNMPVRVCLWASTALVYGLCERVGAQESKTALSLQQAAIGRSAADVGFLCSLNKAGNSTARLVCRTPELRHRKCMGAKAASSLQQAAIGRRTV